MTVTFATGFRIGTGVAGSGLDEVVDRNDLLRSSSLKGVLRAEARLLLPCAGSDDHPFMRAVFGDARTPSPWNFHAALADPPKIAPEVGIRLDKDGQVAPGAMMVKEVVAAPSATLTVERRGVPSRDGIPASVTDDAIECHLALIHLAARLTDKLGQRRTRGLGWVAMTSSRDVDADAKLVWRIREQGKA